MIYPHQFVCAFAFGLLFGFAISSHLITNPVYLTVGLILFVVSLLLNFPSGVKLLAVFLVGISLSLLRWHSFQQLPANHIKHLTGREVVLTGRVSSLPTVRNRVQNLTLQTLEANNHPVVGAVAAVIYSDDILEYGDIIKGQFGLAVPESTETFNEVSHLLKDNILAKAESSGSVQVVTNRPDWRTPLYHLKIWFINIIREMVPEPSSSLLAGILVGSRENLSKDFKQDLNYSGTTHLVALSGYNIAIMADLATKIFKWLPYKISLGISGLFIVAFVAMTGASSSAVRAAILGCLLLLSSSWGRRRNVTNALLLAAALMTWINPHILQHDISFQLSMAAASGIIFVTPLILPKIPTLRFGLSDILATTLGAQITTIPISLHYFGGISLASILTNLLILPVIPFIMLAGTIVTFLVGFVPQLDILSFVVLLPLTFVVAVIKYFGDLPYSYLSLPLLPAILVSIYYAVIILVVIRYHHVSPKPST